LVLQARCSLEALARKNVAGAGLMKDEHAGKGWFSIRRVTRCEHHLKLRTES